MISRLRTEIVLVVSGIIAIGCVGPIKYEMTTDFPAAVLQVAGAPPVIDGRTRFRGIFCQLLAASPEFKEDEGACDTFLMRLSDEQEQECPDRPPPGQIPRYRVLIVPGFLNECFAHIALPFENDMEILNRRGFKIEEIIVGGRSSSDANAVYLADVIEQMELESDEKIILVGHSKGAVDILHCLVSFPQAARRVAAVVSVAGAINGSPLAVAANSSFFYPTWKLFMAGCKKGDDGALGSLTPATRLQWIAAHPLPSSVRYFSVATFTDRDEINMLLKTGYDLLWVYSPRNDGLLLTADQLIPGGTLLGYVNADHLSVALALEDRHFLVSNTVKARRPFPRRVLLEAILLDVAETLATRQE